jgi:hypothetical protein
MPTSLFASWISQFYPVALMLAIAQLLFATLRIGQAVFGSPSSIATNHEATIIGQSSLIAQSNRKYFRPERVDGGIAKTNVFS